MTTQAKHTHAPLERLRHHVSGAISRGEAVPVVEVSAPATHTPGPWTVGGRSLPSTHAVPVRVNGENLAWVCGLDSALRFSEGETAANARLIAAAPDLLEALRKALWWLGEVAGDLDAEGLWGDEEQDVLELLQAATAKAEGRAGE